VKPRLDVFVVRTQSRSFSSLVCDQCGMLVCDVQPGDTLAVLVATVTEHVCERLVHDYAGEKTLQEMIAEIEEQCVIRKIWRANAGWGMMTMTFAVAESHAERAKSARRQGASRAAYDPCEGGVVHRYHETLEACVRAEHARICGSDP
jgi:hypothetical protein